MLKRQPLKARSANPRCKWCRERFAPERTGQICCKDSCAILYVTKKNAAKRAKLTKPPKDPEQLRLEKEKRALKRAANSESKAWHIQRLQKRFNAYIRLRDAAAPCISCGRHHHGQYHAGHYRATGGHPELRFDEANVHKQCSACNNHKSGNIAGYRPNLIAKIGLAEVERLEGPQPPKHYTIPELDAMFAHYGRLIKELGGDG